MRLFKDKKEFILVQNLKMEILLLFQKQNRLIPKRELCALLNIKGAQRKDLKQALAEIKKIGFVPSSASLTSKQEQDRKKEKAPSQKPRKESSFQSNDHFDDRKRGSKSHVKASKKRQILDETLSPRMRKIEPVRKRASINTTIMGLFCHRGDRMWIESVHRKIPFMPIELLDHDREQVEKFGLIHHDVVQFQVSIKGRVNILEKVGNLSEPKVFSLMAIYNADVPFEFSKEAIKLAKNAKVPLLADRSDYRSLPLVTIDGDDARDFDDAVYARPDDTVGSDGMPLNPGGWFAIVAIADVAEYVRPFDALDQEAFNRGNSIYFADRVVPMLPEALSNEMCSLKPNEDRACLAVEMHISAEGNLESFIFKRGLMRSQHRLTYTKVQALLDRKDHLEEHQDEDSKLWHTILKPLYGVYKALRSARNHRGSLELTSHERKVLFHEDGSIKAIVPYVQTTSHRLIEELMIAANVAAAKTLDKYQWPCLYRVHDRPDDTRVMNMKRVVSSLGLSVPKDKKLSQKAFNVILAIHSPFQRMIHDLVLRSQAQALYSPENVGHFGLGLTHYAHFTSPIRRYADLCVHRALIGALNLGEGGQNRLPFEELAQIGNHISATERQAAKLERDVMDRYLVLYLEKYVGFSFEAIIVGVTGVGIFFELDMGAQGFLHKKDLPDDYYIFDEEHHRYVGKRTRRTFQLGDKIRVMLDAADARSATTVFSLEDVYIKARHDQKNHDKSHKKSFSKTRSDDFKKTQTKHHDDVETTKGHDQKKKPIKSVQKNKKAGGVKRRKSITMKNLKK